MDSKFFQQDDGYYRCYVKTCLVKQDDITRLNLPVKTFFQIVMQNGFDITEEITTHEAGECVTAFIAVKETDKDAIKAYEGFIGDTPESLLTDTVAVDDIGEPKTPYFTEVI